MNSPQLDEKEIFLKAMTKKLLEEQVAYVEGVCEQHPDLRDRIISLLKSHNESQGVLDIPPPGVVATDIRPITEQPGDVIGPYKLLQQIGEGGFGVVYMAEQTKPVRRKVALKIIKPGMDTKEVIARFEAERQALALMDHPNIAKVLDAGSTESGRPYFVMELVKGVPLTEYCDKNHLTGTERLKLFVQVCHAIQHAHQKGVIHRDLKPTNIMVTLHDGKPVPKVIDFGVSKALSQQLTEKTLFTAYGQMVGTPAYMSPEQAEMSGLDIDTRSDVYSLGVLLYELLTGSTPFDKKRLRSAGYAEMQRIIREEEPVKPSTKLTTLGELASIVSSNRGTDPKKLGQMIRGDLDWIVMKALDKERNRRYETANGFAADIERFLADEPVVACPPSTGYRIRKFARRNKAAFTVTTAALLVLVAVAVGSTIAAKQFRDLAQRNADLVVITQKSEKDALQAQEEAEEARDGEKNQRVKAERQTKIATDALADAQEQRERAEANYALARSAVDEFLNQVTENELLTVPGMQSLREELLTSALEFYERFAQDDANSEEFQLELARTYSRIAKIRQGLGQGELGLAANQKSLQLFEQLLDDGNENSDVRLGLAKCYFFDSRLQDAIEQCESVLRDDPEHVEARRLLGDTFNQLGIKAKKKSQRAEALGNYEKCLSLREGLVEEFPDNPDYLAGMGGIMNNIGTVLLDEREFDAALKMFNQGVDYTARAYQKSPQTVLWGQWLAINLGNYATILNAKGRQEEALIHYEQAVKIRRKLMVENPNIPSLRGQLADALQQLGKYQQSLELTDESNRTHRALTELLENTPQNTPDDKVKLAIVYGSLATPPAGVLEDDADQARADRQFYARRAIETLRQAIADGYREFNTLDSHESLAALRELETYQEQIAPLIAAKRADSVRASQSADSATSQERLSEGAQVLNDLIGSSSDALQHEKTLAKVQAALGTLQIRQERFDEAEQSLNTAIELNKKLLAADPDDTELQLDLLNTKAVQGDLYWNLDRLPEAHTVFNSLLAEYESLSEKAKLDVEAVDSGWAKRFAVKEREICWQYGRLGLWDLAAEHAKRSIQLGRTADLVWDSRLAALLLHQQSEESYRDFCRTYYQAFKDAQPIETNESLKTFHLLYSCGLIENPEISAEELIDLGRQVLETEPENGWYRFCFALMLYRSGQYTEALGTIPYPDSGVVTFSAGYLCAMLHFGQGNKERARQILNETEASYREYCSKAFQGRGHSFPEPFDEWWNELVYGRVLRTEAHRTIIPDWQNHDVEIHLIQALGYELVGETELAGKELQLAEQAFPTAHDNKLETTEQLAFTAESLAEVLLEQNGKQRIWSVLRPKSIMSQHGTTLTLQEDGSILANGNNPPTDTYTLIVPVNKSRQIDAIRLEALAHESLPKNGPGRGDSGNFNLLEFAIFSKRADGVFRPVSLSGVTSDGTDYHFPLTLSNWHWASKAGESHPAFYELESPLKLDQGAELKIVLPFMSSPEWPQLTLGCFRLSVCKSPDLLAISNSFARLAATYDTLGDEQTAQKILTDHPSSRAAFAEYLSAKGEWDRGLSMYNKLIEENTTDTSLLIKRATAYHSSGQWDLAQADWERVFEIAGDDPNLLLKRAEFYASAKRWDLAKADALRAVELAPREARAIFEFCQQAERWSESAVFGLKLIDQEPNETLTWLNVAPVFVLADQKDQYARFCERMVEQFSGIQDVVTNERLCHACLLRPDAMDVSLLPGEVLARALEQEQNLPDWFPQWGWSSLALWAYRTGDPQSAIEYAGKSQDHADSVYVDARCLAVVAMAQHELENEEAARKALDELAQLVSTFSYQDVNNHDQLIPKILLREAKAKITGKTSNESEPSAGSTERPAAESSSDSGSRTAPQALKASKP